MGYVYAGAAIVAALLTAAGQYKQGRDAKAVYEYNAAVASQESEYQKKKTDYELSRHDEDLRRLIGRQRTVFGASGIDPSTGTPLSILADTTTQAAIDREVLRSTGSINAWRAESQSSLLGDQAGQFMTGGLINAGSTLLNAASKWDYKPKGKKK